MKRTERRGVASVVLLGAALLVAASSCGSSSEANAGRAYTLDNVCEQLAQELCPLAKPCCEANELPYILEGCEAEQLEGCGERVALAKAERITFDAQAADACMTKTASLMQKCQLSTADDLREYAEMRAVCMSIFKGARAEGESCESDIDCAPPSDANLFASCRSGTCVHWTIYAGEGEECDQSKLVDCQAGLYCRTSSPGVPPGTCEKVSAIGEHCDFPTQCEASAYCDPLGSECVARKAVGEACSSSNECGIHGCIDGECAVLPVVDHATCNGGMGQPEPPGPFGPPN